MTNLVGPDYDKPCPRCGLPMGNSAGLGLCGMCQFIRPQGPDPRDEQIAALTVERDCWRRRLHSADDLLAAIDVALGGLPRGVDRVENAQLVVAERDAARKELKRANDALWAERETHAGARMRAEKAESEIARLRALVEKAYREGWRDGTMDDTPLDQLVTHAWNNSDAKRALDDTPTQQGDQP